MTKYLLKVSPRFSRKYRVVERTLIGSSGLLDKLIAASMSRLKCGRSTFGVSKKSVNVSKMV